VRQIVYVSTSVGRQDPVLLDAILRVSRTRNAEQDITGLLMSGGLRFLQIIEGPPPALTDLMRRIRADDRHQSMTVLVDRRLEACAFGGWAMAHYDAPKLRDYATLGEMITLICAKMTDATLLQQLESFAQTFATGPVTRRLAPWTSPSCYLDPLALDSRH